jgi:hypothetical protein
MNRVKTKPTMIDGVAIHNVEFACQPYRFGSMADSNDKMLEKHLGPTYRAWDRKGNPDVLVAECGIGDGVRVFLMKRCSGAFYSGSEPEYCGTIVKVGNKLTYVPVAGDDIDALVKLNTAFKTLPDMFDTHPSYRPSCDVSRPAMKAIADAYDARAAMFGDPRRAYRYGSKS